MNMPRRSERAAPWHTGGAQADRLLRLLDEGRLELAALIPWSSNATFLGQVVLGEDSVPVVYKPMRGEQPLWDFPRRTLAKRETAAYLVCRRLGWDFVPPTVLRTGPHGRGSVQLFVSVDQGAHFFTFRRDPAYRRALQALALFDIVVNNADRKAGHCLAAGCGRVIAIDHGLCFHVEDKLRTVIWDFAGEPIPAELAGALGQLDADLGDAEGDAVRDLASLLDSGELTLLRRRLRQTLDAGSYPNPPEDRRAYPWPPV